MHLQTKPKDIVFNLANKMNDTQLLETANFMQFIQLKNNNGSRDLIKVSESTLNFWDNEEDTVWDNV